MTQPLPERPDFGQLKKQAKDLLNAIHNRIPAALERAAIKDSAADDFALHDAQRIVAREHGFPSWARLKLHVETRRAEAAEARLVEAILSGDRDAVDTLLAERPALRSGSFTVAAALGDMAVARAELTRDPRRATAASGPRQWEPLLYVCFGRCGAGDAERAELARLLLSHGANPHASWIHVDWPEAPLSALYGATGVNSYPELARVLLTAGANPNDGESRYHAAEHNHTACLAVLAEFGADFSGTDKRWGNTPLCFLLGSVHPSTEVRAGVRWLLEHHADPDVRSYADTVNEAPLHVAIRSNWDVATLTLLLDHGADVNAQRTDGRTPYALALMLGRDDVVTLLRERGARAEASTLEVFLGACLRADGETARTMLRREPALPRSLQPHDRFLVEVAARENRADALALMSEVGIDVTSPLHEGATPLHWAAWHGRADATRTLLRAGADKDACDERFKAPPIGWCAHGSQNAGNHAANYAGVAEALISAGAFVPPNTEGNPEVMAVLRKHGFKPQSTNSR